MAEHNRCQLEVLYLQIGHHLLCCEACNLGFGDCLLRFQYLKAFLLDRDLSSIQVTSYYEESLGHVYVDLWLFQLRFAVQLRMAINESKEKFSELPLYELREKYEKTEAGAKFLQESILDSNFPASISCALTV